MKKAPIGLFYGSSTCYTEMAAEKIQRQFAADSMDVINIADTPISEMRHYQQLILGIPTWDFGELQEDWEDHWDDIDAVDLSGKTIALYGLGDQVGYPEWFLDAMGYLHNKVLLQGANIIGYWPNQGYEFTESQALTEDKQYFVGLALDDENEFDQTDDRISTWCDELKTHFTLTP
ncbi:MAG: flavodoxin II [Candidatus Endobugula sp.]|jgi:flavodoxin II